MNRLVAFGAILVILGVVGLSTPWLKFTTSETKDVANIGNLHVQSKEDKVHVIPPAVAGAVIAIGVVILGGGLFRRT